MTVYTMSLGDRILRFLFPDTFRRISEMSASSDRAQATLANLAAKVDALIATAQASNQDAAFDGITNLADEESAKIDAAFPPVEPAPEG